MPDGTKIESLQNQIRKVYAIERVSGAVFLFGLGITMLSFFLSYDPPPSWSSTVFLYWGFAGLVVMLLFLLLYCVARRERNGKIRQLERIGQTIPTCLKCKNEVLSEDSGACPFCGERLKPESS